mgnify:CR=1 FL=1
MSPECFSHKMFGTNMLWAWDIMNLDVKGLDVMSSECFSHGMFVTSMLWARDIFDLDV